jgi:dTDP-4-dehydrorhamnose reductase
MKILVTGAAGMLGTALMGRLKGAYDAVGVDISDFDVTDGLSVSKRVSMVRPDWVVHCAALTNVDACEGEPEKAYRVNAAGAGNVADACRAAGAKMVFLSTDYVFDGGKRSPYVETDPTGPLSVYGMSKLRGEREVQRLLPGALVLRTSWLYGLHGPNFVEAILAQVGKKDELAVVSDQVGSPTYTIDLADAVVRLVEADAVGVVHVTNEGECSWSDYAVKILGLAGVKGVRVRPITTAELGRPAPRPAYSVLSKDKYRAITGHSPRAWEEALAGYIKSRRVLG